MKRTALFEEHQKLKAKMAPFANFEMPIQYSGVKEEVFATRKNVGIFDVSHMGEFFVHGEECFEFIDHLVTNDILGADSGKAVYSPMCREDGTVIDDLIVYKLGDKKAMICVNAANIEKDWQWIEQQKNNFQVNVENHSENYSLIAIQGPNSTELLSELGLNEATEIDYYSCKAFPSEGIIAARTGYTGEDGFEVFAPHDTCINLWQKSISWGATPCGLAARDVLRLEVCYPLYGHELDDELTPLDSSLKWTVKKNGKDFIGKENLDSYAPKYRLLKLSIEKGIPRQNYLVVNKSEEIIGKVTSGTFSPVVGKGIALAHVEKTKFKKDEPIFIVIRNNHVEALIHDKPFVTGGHK